MKKKARFFSLSALLVLIFVVSLSFSGCRFTFDKDDSWKEEYDTSAPNLNNVGFGKDNANEDGWYITMDDNFDGNQLSENWCPTKNYQRNVQMYWCQDTISVEDGMLKIHIEEAGKHNCTQGHEHTDTPVTGLVGTIDPNKSYGEDSLLFSQAFGYFEVRCKIPYSDAALGAFWLQNPDMGKIGNNGEDGSEIDILESGFFNNKTLLGSCIHYDGYGDNQHSIAGIQDVGVNTYEGFHTYGLKWTPTEYVFFFDGKPYWATDANGVCKTPCYINLSGHVLQNCKKGPYRQKFGKLEECEFVIDYVKVYQNSNYESEIRTPESFTETAK